MNPHPNPDDLVRYARTPESMRQVRAASIEQHLLACGGCRAAVAAAAPLESVRGSWTRVADAIDHPPRRALASASNRLLPDRYARPVSATIGLQGAWLASTLVLAGAAALINRVAETDRLFVSFAPLVAVAIVVVMFAPAGEPGGEAAYATPVFGFGLALRRLVAALVPALIALGLVAMFVADLDVDSLVWLLPALALTTTTLALTTYVSAHVAGAVATTMWMAAVFVVGRANHFDLIDRWRGVDLFGQRGQAVATMVTVAAALVIALRRECIATPEVSW